MVPFVALFFWPVVVLILFKRLKPATALCWSVIAGYLLLPPRTAIDLPLLPEIDKDFIPSFAAFCIAMIVVGRQHVLTYTSGQADAPSVLKGWVPRSWIGFALFATLIAGSLLTVVTNTDVLVYGTRRLPSLRLYDGFSSILMTGVAMLPLLLGRKYLATGQSHKTLLLVLCVAGLIYSLPTLYEVRMSPQINKMVYGFFPHSWRQHLRSDGFRPVVFLNHGLTLGIFLSCAILAALGSFRISQPKHKGIFLGAAIWLFLTLFLAKTLGAFLITFVLAPVVLLLSVRFQLIVAAVVAGTVLFYPALRGSGAIPTEGVVGVAASIDQTRAASLQYRLDNEDRLLEKANERPFFGWGKWGRSRVFDERGKDISTTDGRWVISIGNEGWVGYLARFGLLTVPILLLAWRQKKYEVTLATSTLCIVLAANLVDLIPNAGLTPITWLVAGALLGRLEVQSSNVVSVASPPQTGTDRIRHHAKTRPVQGRLQPNLKTPAREAPKYTRYPRTAHKPRPSET